MPGTQNGCEHWDKHVEAHMIPTVLTIGQETTVVAGLRNKSSIPADKWSAEADKSSVSCAPGSCVAPAFRVGGRNNPPPDTGIFRRSNCRRRGGIISDLRQGLTAFHPFCEFTTRSTATIPRRRKRFTRMNLGRNGVGPGTYAPHICLCLSPGRSRLLPVTESVELPPKLGTNT